MAVRVLAALLLVVAIALGSLWALGRGWFVEPWGTGAPTPLPIPADVVATRASAQREAAQVAGVASPKQILFGDLHVHTTYSADAFQMALPMMGGDGARPVSDACDFARFCSSLDFWSINDHAELLTPARWQETKESIRRCNAVAGDPANPDLVSFLGWEWTQVGTNPANHYGHKNVVLLESDEQHTPARPIAAGSPPDTPPLTLGTPSAFGLGLFALQHWSDGGPESARYLNDLTDVPTCPDDVPVRQLGADCRELTRTPRELFAKLDDWGFPALVIPHGTTWGIYTPPGSSWDKQLDAEQHDVGRQTLIEVFSGHGNSEEFRSWREVVLQPDGTRACPEPVDSFLPSCWRAGEIIRERCERAGQPEGACDALAAEARQNWVDADRNAGARTVPGAAPAEWQDAGQCRNCFQPSFNYRPRSSVQYILALRRADPAGELRFRLGFIASSDNHSARPGTGYKEYGRTSMTEARLGQVVRSPLGRSPPAERVPHSERFDAYASSLPVFAIWETERAASFFLTGGLAAVHAEGRGREAIWQALRRHEVYGTSGPRILLWFDLVNAGGASAPGASARLPMGSDARMSVAPSFEVRAVGSFEQLPGCPEFSRSSLSPERLARLCGGECYHPSDTRRRIARVEVIRIRPRTSPDEDVAALIEDPWRVFPCAPDPGGCRVQFSDDEFPTLARDAIYYVRALEEPSLAVAADPLGCERDAAGLCLRTRPCFARGSDDDCTAPTQERAWSSPIYVDYGGTS